MDEILLLALERFIASYVHSERVKSEKKKMWSSWQNN